MSASAVWSARQPAVEEFGQKGAADPLLIVVSGLEPRAVRAAKPMGERPVLLAGQRAFILKRIAVRPDTSIRALRAELAEAGILVSYGAVWTMLGGVGGNARFFADHIMERDGRAGRTRAA